MNKLLTRKNRIFIMVITILVIIASSSVILLPFDQVGFILFLLTVLISSVGILRGPIVALGITLSLFFVIGSILFWGSFSGLPLFESDIPVFILLGWMTLLLIISIITGRFSLLTKELTTGHEQLEEQIRTLVAIDPVTGFDNKDRMLLELELEFSRSKRYQHTFSFLLIKINHFDEFRKLYGEVELTNLLRHLSRGIYESTRMSDEKFRPEQDLFALLLTDTPIDAIEIVTNKITEKLRVFQLENGKYVTLSFEFGYAGFDPEIESYHVLYEQAKEQVFIHES